MITINEIGNFLAVSGSGEANYGKVYFSRAGEDTQIYGARTMGADLNVFYITAADPIAVEEGDFLIKKG